MNICMTFGGTADSLIRHGYARRVDRAEGMDLLAEAYANSLVQFGENVQRDVAFICNCCGCCCEAMIAARRFGRLDPVHTTNFLPHVDAAACNGCGEVRGRLPRGGDDARLRERSRTSRGSDAPRSTPASAWAAASAPASAPRTACGWSRARSA